MVIRLVGLGIILIVIGGLLFYNYELTENIQVVRIVISGPRDWICENFTVPAGEYVLRGAILPDFSIVTVEFYLTAGDAIGFLFLDQQDFLSLFSDKEDFMSWQDGSMVRNPFPAGESVAEAEMNFSIPHGGGWTFVWNNVNSSEPKEVSANVTWTGEKVEYREIIRGRSLGEQMVGAIGGIILIVGIWFVVFGLTVLFLTYRSNRSARLREQVPLQVLCLR